MNVSLNILDAKTETSMAALKASWQHCVRCEIGVMAHRHVFARGTLPCDLLFVGEAPGKTEDFTGWPFIGKSGKLLEEWIAESCQGLSCAITNTVLCRPCDAKDGPNRPPTLNEKANCYPRFKEFVVKVARPKAFVLVGRHAGELDTGTAPTLHIPHPAYALYNGGRGSRPDVQARQMLQNFTRKDGVLCQWLKSAV